MKHFNKPSAESEYFNGIIRNDGNVKVFTTSMYYDPADNYDIYVVIKNNASYYWHSSKDTESKQYVELSFLNSVVDVSSYMFSPGNNGAFYTVTWTINCSMNNVDWVNIDAHVNEQKIKSSGTMVLFDVKRRAKCRSFRFYFPGQDSKQRYYNYLGPVEFYGNVYPFSNCFTKIKHSNYCYIHCCSMLFIVRS